jgi:hypothetical protein
MARPKTLAGGRPPKVRNRAEGWLKDLLAQGEQSMNRILALGLNENPPLLKDTLKRAKKNLSIRSFRKNGIWYWTAGELPRWSPQVDIEQEAKRIFDAAVQLDDLIARADSKTRKRFVELRTQAQTQRTVFEQIAVMSLEEVEQNLSALAEAERPFGLTEEDQKRKDALLLRRSQLKNEAF